MTRCNEGNKPEQTVCSGLTWQLTGFIAGCSHRACPTVLAAVLQGLLPALAPVTPHMAEDAWSHLPWEAHVSSVFQVGSLYPFFCSFQPLRPSTVFAPPSPGDSCRRQYMHVMRASW